MSAAAVVHLVAALVVLAEALNKLERADLWAGRRGIRSRARCAVFLLMPWAWQRAHVVTALKVAGWACLAVGAAYSLLIPPAPPHLAVIGGFALLIVRSRLKEG